MKKKWLLLFLLSPLSVFALYNGNPSLPQMPEVGVFISKDAWVGLKVGYEIDWSYDVCIELESPSLSPKRAHGYKALTQFGVLTLNFANRVEMFADLGSLCCKWSYDLNDTQDLSFRTDTNFAWGVGGRVLLAYWGDLQLSVNASYVDSHPDINHIDLKGREFSSQSAHLHWNAWQVGGGIAWKFGWFYPYAGIDYLNTKLEARSLKSVAFLLPKDELTFKVEDSFGIFLGLGVGPTKGFNLNVEGRFINENALSFSMDFRF